MQIIYSSRAMREMAIKQGIAKGHLNPKAVQRLRVSNIVKTLDEQHGEPVRVRKSLEAKLNKSHYVPEWYGKSYCDARVVFGEGHHDTSCNGHCDFEPDVRDFRTTEKLEAFSNVKLNSYVL